MNIIQVYSTNGVKTFFTVLLVILAVITFFNFQTVEIPTFQVAIEMILGQQDMKSAYLAFGSNLLVALGLGAVGIVWFKDSLKSNYDTDPTLNAIISMSTGTVAILLSIPFFEYIYSSLLGLVVIVLIIFGIMYGPDEGSTKRRKRY